MCPADQLFEGWLKTLLNLMVPPPISRQSTLEKLLTAAEGEGQGSGSFDVKDSLNSSYLLQSEPTDADAFTRCQPVIDLNLVDVCCLILQQKKKLTESQKKLTENQQDILSEDSGVLPG